MTALRLKTHPPGYVAPVELPILEYRALLGRRLPPCRECGGGLAVDPPDVLPGRVVCRLCGREYAEVVTQLRPPFDPGAELPTKRGRPPKALVASGEPRTPCTDCRTRPARTNSPRCWGCATAQGAAAREARAERIRHLVALLETGPQLSARLAIELNIALDNVRYVVRAARDAGYPITARGHRYRLEEVAS